MPPAVAGFVTSVAAALCYGMCVSETKLSTMVVQEDDDQQKSAKQTLEGEDIEFLHDAQTVSSVGASTVLQEAAQDGFFGNNCFLEISPTSTDALDSVVAAPLAKKKK